MSLVLENDAILKALLYLAIPSTRQNVLGSLEGNVTKCAEGDGAHLVLGISNTAHGIHCMQSGIEHMGIFCQRLPDTTLP